MNKEAAAAYARAHAEPQSKAMCAHHVRLALMNGGGVPLSGWPEYACNYDPYLERYGFTRIPGEQYSPQPGDVVVIQPHPGGHPAGHIALYDGTAWISDFVQRDFWGGPGFRAAQPRHAFYRHQSATTETSGVPAGGDAIAAKPASAAPDYRVVQVLLRYLGLDPGPHDGKPGPRTSAAIRAFQQSQNAAPTGEPDGAFVAAATAAARSRFGRDRPADIRLVQQLLTDRGFPVGQTDGLWGPRTRNAIGAFLQSTGAPPASVSDVDTALLDKLLQ